MAPKQIVLAMAVIVPAFISGYAVFRNQRGNSSLPAYARGGTSGANGEFRSDGTASSNPIVDALPSKSRRSASLEEKLTQIDSVFRRLSNGNEDDMSEGLQETLEALVDDLEQLAKASPDDLRTLASMALDPPRSLVSRQAMLLALGRLDHEISRKAILMAIRGEDDPAVRQMAIHSLYQGFGAEDRVRLGLGSGARILKLDSQGGEFVEALSYVILSASGSDLDTAGLKTLAVHALVDLDGPSSVRDKASSLGLALLDSQDEAVAAAAVERFSKRIAREAEVNWLVPRLAAIGESTRSQLVRERVACAIASVEPERAVKLTAIGLGDPDPATRHRCIARLAQLRVASSVVSPVLQAVVRSERIVEERVAAVRAFGELERWSADTRDFLYQVAREHSEDGVRAAVIETIARKEGSAAARDLVFDALAHENRPTIVISAARSMTYLPRAWSPEINALCVKRLGVGTSDDLSAELAGALGVHGTADEIPLLRRLVNDTKSERVKSVAAGAIEAIRRRIPN